MEDWVLSALKDAGGTATILAVAKHVWETREKDIRGQPDALYEWQYEMRWAADQLRKQGKIGFERKGGRSGKSVWKLQKSKPSEQPPLDDDVPF